jgi:hypothetical protein
MARNTLSVLRSGAAPASSDFLSADFTGTPLLLFCFCRRCEPAE